MDNKKYEPYISLEQVLAYDPKKPETTTHSPFVDAVVEAMHTVKPAAGEYVARRLGLDYREMSGALHVLTGYSYTDLRTQWVLYNFDRLHQEKPKLRGDALALELGFLDRSSLWRMLEREHHKHHRRQHLTREYIQQALAKLRAEKERENGA